MTTELSYRNEGANVYAQDGTLVCIAVDPLDAEVLAGLLRWKVDVHPEPTPEPDPWPMAPLIVADWTEGGGSGRCLLIADGPTPAAAYVPVTGDEDYDGYRLIRQGRAGETITNVVPVTVVPVAALPVLWYALDQWLAGTLRGSHEDLKRLVGAVVGLREQIEALGLD